MFEQNYSNRRSTPLVVVIVSLVVVVLGIAFRFYGLDTKFYFQDEAITSLIVGGLTKQEFIIQEYDGRVRPAEEIRTIDGTPGQSVSRTIHALASSDTLHPPLYYVLEQFWTRSLGTSITARRALSAIFGAAAVIAIYWLGLGLFGDVLPALIACALFAISPVQVLYSQQAREYSLFSLIIVLTTTIFIRAMKSNHWTLWCVLAGLGAVGLYTFPTFGFLLVAFALVALTLEGWRLRQPRVLACIGAVAGSFALYLPWITQIYFRAHSSGVTIYASPLSTAYKLLIDTGTPFFDLEYANIRLMPVLLVVVGIVVFALFRVAKTAARPTRLLIWYMIASVCVLLLFPDTVGHAGHSSFEVRYAMAAWTALVLAVAYALSYRFHEQSAMSRRVLMSIYAFLLIAATASDTISAKAPFWYPTNHEVALGGIVNALNADRTPLLLSVAPDHDWDYILAISNYAGPGVNFELANSPSAVHDALSQGYDTYLLADPRSADLASISRYARIVPVLSTVNPPSAMTDPKDAYRWQVKHRSSGISMNPWLYRLTRI